MRDFQPTRLFPRSWRGVGLSIAALAILFALPTSHAKRAPVDDVTGIDRDLAQVFTAKSLTPTAIADDSEFLRRVTLDLIGRVPTLDETESFLAETSNRKRADLVDRLLANEDYADYWAALYMDTLVGRKTRLAFKKAQPAHEYFRQAFLENRPYDVMTREILTAQGSVNDNGATGFVAARAFNGGTVEQVAGMTARAFLGLQIQCAQCHDHPYVSSFKQHDFAEFAAFFGHTKGKRVDKVFAVEDRVIPMRIKDRPSFKKRLEKRPSLIYAVTEPSFFDTGITQAPDESRREWLTRAILSTDEFAQVTVNRTWMQLFGAPISGPWDDLGYIGHTDRPPLLVDLASQFRASGFDHKALLRTIVLSSAYQRTSRGGGDVAVIERLEGEFGRASIRPLSARSALQFDHHSNRSG